MFATLTAGVLNPFATTFKAEGSERATTEALTTALGSVSGEQPSMKQYTFPFDLAGAQELSGTQTMTQPTIVRTNSQPLRPALSLRPRLRLQATACRPCKGEHHKALVGGQTTTTPTTTTATMKTTTMTTTTKTMRTSTMTTMTMSTLSTEATRS